MRVFDKYTFNIAGKVKFKDTKKYMDKILEELGLAYKNVSFTYEGFRTSLEQMLDKYPNLSKYCYENVQYGGQKVLTSLTPNWTKGELYAETADWDSLFEIVLKCPRGMNITGTLVLDQIDWYGEGVKEAALCCHKDQKDKAQIFLTHNIINSQIILQRNYNDGNKYNNVSVIVEAALGVNDEPRDTTDIIKKLEPYLGIPETTERICRSSLAEEWAIIEKEWSCREILNKRIEEFYPNKRKFNEAEFIPNIADKKKIKAAFKGTSFEIGDRKGLLPGMNHVFCKDAHNRQYEILFDRTQSSPDYFYWYVIIKGYNFSILPDQNVMHVSSENEASEKLSMIAKFCEELVEDFDQLLSDHFGATPEWYSY